MITCCQSVFLLISLLRQLILKIGYLSRRSMFLSIFKKVSSVAASMPHIGYQVVGVINCISVGADDGDLPGNRFLAGWVAATIKTLGQIYLSFGWVVGQQQRERDFRILLLCLNYTLRRQPVKTAVFAYHELRDAVFNDMLLNGCTESGQQIIRGFAMADEEATFSTHNEKSPLLSYFNSKGLIFSMGIEYHFHMKVR